MTTAERLSAHATLLDVNGKHALSDVVGIGTQHSHVHGEQFVGDGVLVAFTLAHTPLYGVDAYVSGVRVDVVVAGAVVTFSVAPLLAALIRMTYEF